MKRCRKCQVEKNLSDFYRDSRKPDGVTPRCKACLYTPTGRAHLRKPDKLCNACKERKSKESFYQSDNLCKPCRKVALRTFGGG